MKALRWFPSDLWPHQVAALHMLQAFLDDSSAHGSLVQMPTGTGKTLVIAALAQETDGAVLVLGPSAQLVRQLHADVGGMAWSGLHVDFGIDKARAVVPLLRSQQAELVAGLRSPNSSAFVGTMQALLDIATSAPELYAALRERCTLVIVDEGHRQPAPAWSRAIEGLEAKVALFSATPYRNDPRVFNIDRDHVFYVSWRYAVEGDFVRDVAFMTIAKDEPADFARAAATELLRLAEAGDVAEDAKAILRFGNRAALDVAVQSLMASDAARRLGFVAVHERFRDDAHRLQSLGDLRSRTERLLLHQFKLTEGLDEPRCSVLFLHADFGNEKELVQQIGRVVRRRPARGTGDDAIARVYVRASSTAPAAFMAYRLFDDRVRAEGRPIVMDADKYGRRLRDLGVPAEYSGRRYRIAPPAALDDRGASDPPTRKAREAAVQELLADVLPQRRCLVFEVSPDFDVRHWASAIVEALAGDENREILAEGFHSTEIEEQKAHIVVTHVADTSDLFERTALLENRYGIIVSYEYDGRLYVHVSGGGPIPDGPNMNVAELGALIPDDADTTIREIGLSSADPQPFAVRTSSMAGASLANAPPNFTDVLNVVSRAKARLRALDGNRVTRYLGFANGRLTDGRVGRVNVKTFMAWCRGIGEEIDRGSPIAAFFGRYSQRVPAPVNVVPSSVLIDVQRLGDSLQFARLSDGCALDLDDYCVPALLIPGTDTYALRIGAFEGENAADYHATIAYDKARRRFTFESSDLRDFSAIDDGQTIMLEAAINREQAFRILIAGTSVAYMDGAFFDFGPRSERMVRVVEAIVHADIKILGCTSEKGKWGNGRGWDDSSLFALVDKRKGRFNVPGLDHQWTLVCDDLGYELGDFIAYDEQRRAIAFYHLKRKKTNSNIGASGLHDVLAQAVQNLEFVRFGGSPIPNSRAKRWDEPWRAEKGTYQVSTRLRGKTPPQNGKFALKAIRSLLADPTTERYVCVVVAGALKRGFLLQQLKRSTASRSPGATQAYLQILSFNAAVAQSGAQPVIICD